MHLRPKTLWKETIIKSVKPKETKSPLSRPKTPKSISELPEPITNITKKNNKKTLIAPTPRRTKLSVSQMIKSFEK